MPTLPVLKGREVLQALLRSNFYIHHQRGSHARLFHKTRLDLKVTVPIHNKDLPERTLRTILKQADISDKEFLEMLR